MSDYGRRRVETALAWEYEVPKLLRAYDQLFDSVSERQDETSVSYQRERPHE
jgi:hypothetical protein